ncbi:MAG: N-glycosylase/DNA lyase [Candidatus Delongbacteria bacterium]|jgi:N-glycosylase/DNA lyase|nr:N-glycosylase/DNA lyase [Candidatus Delongbacteria bacterium]MDY0017001.1 N-glycosylase/DNA lyase [Candidatus Delongbacteria bacterium]
MKNEINELKILYNTISEDIRNRLEGFRSGFLKTDNDSLFAELSFCTLTPQSKAKSCWKCVEYLRDSGLLYNAGKEVLSRSITGVRFHNNKSAYIEANRKLFYSMDFKKFILDNADDIFGLRKWLVDNIKGYSYKEAGHFLRNIGLGSQIAILDRHILKNLVIFGVIPEIPKTISSKTYLEIEDKFLKFSKEIEIPPDHLDILLWYKQTGEIFK